MALVESTSSAMVLDLAAGSPVRSWRPSVDRPRSVMFGLYTGGFAAKTRNGVVTAHSNNRRCAASPAVRQKKRRAASECRMVDHFAVRIALVRAAQ